MTAQDLKNSILQLAVQGKLVPQDSNDEPASELMKRIRAEKERLVKEGKIKKEKALAPITEDEMPFDIPESWEWVRLSDISSITSGGTPSRTISAYWDGNIPWVKIGDISGKYVSYTEEKITESGLNSSSAKIFPPGTLLYTIFATIGTVGILNIDAATNQAVAGVTFYGDYNTDYMYYVLVGLKDILVAKGKGMAQMNINQSILKNTPIPIPPLAEQERIVAKIEELLPYIEEYDKAEKQLSSLNAEFPDKLRKSILQQAVMGKLTEREPADEPASELLKRIHTEKENLIKEGKIKKEKPLPPISEDEIPFEIPETWEWVRLVDICSLIGDIDHNMPKPVEESNGVKFLSAKDLLDDGTINYTKNIKYISETDFRRLSQKALPQKNDIIYSRIGAALGKARVVENDIRFLVSYSCCVIRSIEINSWYLRYYLESPYILEHTYAARQSIGVPDLGMSEIKNYLIALPPLTEQKRIVARVEELLKICDELK